MYINTRAILCLCQVDRGQYFTSVSVATETAAVSAPLTPNTANCTMAYKWAPFIIINQWPNPLTVSHGTSVSVRVSDHRASHTHTQACVRLWNERRNTINKSFYLFMYFCLKVFLFVGNLRNLFLIIASSWQPLASSVISRFFWLNFRLSYY